MKAAIYRLVVTALFYTASATWLHADIAYQQQLTVTKPAATGESHSCVVLMHGLARTSSSMNDLAEVLVDNNYIVVNVDYPSRKFAIQTLASNTVPAGVQACEAVGATDIRFVTHSLGGILLRAYTKTTPVKAITRAVMLGPPNQGSEVVDTMRDVPGFLWLNGPAGQQLGTGDNGVPASLGDAQFDVGIVAGTASINPILSSYLPDPDDGKVSVASSKLAGMCAHLQLDVSHPFLMKDDGVIAEVVSYLQTGRFTTEAAEYPDCKFRDQ